MLTDHTNDRVECLRGQLVGPIQTLEVGVTSNYFTESMLTDNDS